MLLENVSIQGLDEDFGLNIQDEADMDLFVQESEESWSNLHLAVMRAEHVSIVNEDAVLLEGVIAGYWEKVVTWFQKMWAAIKQFFANIWMKITGLWKNRKAWIVRYNSAIKSGEVKLVANKTLITAPEGDKFLDPKTTITKLSGDKDSMHAQAKKAMDDAAEATKFVTKKTPATAAIVGSAKYFVNNADKYIKSVTEQGKAEIKTTQDGIKVAKSAASVAKSAKDKDASDAQVTEIERLKLQLKVIKYERSKAISYINAQSSVAFAICKKAASAGTTTTKEAYNAKPVKEETSILSEFGYKD